MDGKSRGKSKLKKGRIRDLSKAVAALAVTALLETAIQKVAEDPRVRTKAKALGKALQERARVAGRKVSQVARKATTRPA